MGENKPSDTKAAPPPGQPTAPSRAPASGLTPQVPRPRPRPGDSERHFQAALEAGTRAGSSLSELRRTIHDLENGISLAADANLHLGQELGALRSVLEAASDQQRALRERVLLLEQELNAAERERKFLVAQQDEFLEALLDEHEAELRARELGGQTTRMGSEVAAMAEQLVGSESARLQAEQELAFLRSELLATQAARDEARVLARKHAIERDALRAEASQLRASLGVHRPSTNPPPASGSRAPSFLPAPPLQLDAGELDATLHPTPLAPKVAPSDAPPPAAQPQDPDAESPVASVFPRETTRPGVGDPKPAERPPVSFGPPPEAWTAPPPAPAASTARSPWPVSAASLPPEATLALPTLKRKPDPTTRPLIDYSLGEGGVESETLEGARLRSSKPPRT